MRLSIPAFVWLSPREMCPQHSLLSRASLYGSKVNHLIYLCYAVKFYLDL